MDDLSVSKGVFVHCKKKIGVRPKKQKNETESNLCLEHKSEPWYQAYKEISSAMDDAVAEINANTFRQLLLDLRDFVVKIKNMPLLEDEIPTGILLAGVNLPDHDLLLQKLVLELESVTPYIATVWSRDASNLKNLTEEVVFQIINYNLSDDDNVEVKKNHSTFCALNAWHEETNNGDTPLVIIIPDFESFSPSVLHDFILILSSYMKTIKFVLIFGVATTLHVVHRSLSYDATSKLKCQVFQMQQQAQRLANVLDGIIKSPNIPFKIIDSAFKLLVNIFLWYDFSVDGFLKSYKICLWKHFYRANEKAICCKEGDISKRVATLKSAEFKKLRGLPSVKEHLKTLQTSKDKRIKDTQFKEIVIDLLENYHNYTRDFLIVLKCLFEISVKFINSPFGKKFRQIYEYAISNCDFCETTEYNKAMLSISFLSKEEILSCITIIIDVLTDSESEFEDVIKCLKDHYEMLKNASEAEIIEQQAPKSPVKFKQRSQWKEALAQNSKISKQSAYKKASTDFLNYLREFFRQYLRHPSKMPIYEVFCYTDANMVKTCIKGSTKAVIYNCLNDPHILFEDNNCCTEGNTNISKHPDINIVYKLLMENRKMVNMYDWLQSFITIVDPDLRDFDSDKDRDVDPVLQARFTQAVAELQFLGFIKATRKKTDHVKRLTT